MGPLSKDVLVTEDLLAGHSIDKDDGEGAKGEDSSKSLSIFPLTVIRVCL